MTDTADVNYEHTSSNNFVENFIDDNTNRSCVDIVYIDTQWPKSNTTLYLNGIEQRYF